MKITKKTQVKASIDPIGEPLVVEEVPVEAIVPVTEDELVTVECKYANAIELISAAIESLAEIARDDQIAKDSIANLGVVMLDLKGSC